jgi:hypothetical protein
MKSLGYVHTPIAEHHRWSPYSRRAIASGWGPAGHAARMLLHEMRWRRPPRQFGLKSVALLLSILVHLLGLTALLLVRPPPAAEPVPQGQENAIQVRFIESHPAPPPPPPIPAPPEPVKAPRTARRTASPPSRAPRHAPAPVPARVRPRPRIQPPAAKVAVARPAVTPPDVAPVTPTPVPTPTPPPAKTPAAAKPALPPVALPPPKPVLEISPMAVPPPRVTLPETAPVTLATSTTAKLQPVPTPRPRIAPQAPVAPAIEVQQTSPSLARANAVTATPAATPMPPIEADTRPAIAPIPAPAVSVRLPVQPAPLAAITPVTPAPASSQVLPAAPLSAPRVQIARVQAPSAPQVQAPATALAPVSPTFRAAPSPARPSSVPAPARVASVTPPPSTSTNWALQSDTFSRKLAAKPGRGKAEQAQAGKGSPHGVPGYIQRQPQGNSDVMSREYRGFHYKRTIFDQYWAPDNQSLLTSMLQRLVDALSFHKTIELGHGARINCGGWLLGFGCGGSPPDPMSKMSNDRRLDMAPAKPLVPGLGASVAAPPPAPSPVSSGASVRCETARVAGSPLPPGCPAGKGMLRDGGN